jgi:hypothetical protein
MKDNIIRIDGNIYDLIRAYAEAENKSCCKFATELLSSALSNYQTERSEEIMKKAIHRDNNGLLLTVSQASEVFNLGLQAVTNHAKKAHALLKIGKSVRVDRERFLDYCRTMEYEGSESDGEVNLAEVGEDYPA